MSGLLQGPLTLQNWPCLQSLKSSHCGQGPDEHSDSAQRGSATIVGIGLLLASLSLVVGLGYVGKIFVLHAQAEGTADLAALAAADITRGKLPGDACEVAKDMVEAKSLALSQCISRPDLGTVKIVVTLDLPKPLKDVEITSVAGSPGS